MSKLAPALDAAARTAASLACCMPFFTLYQLETSKPTPRPPITIGIDRANRTAALPRRSHQNPTVFAKPERIAFESLLRRGGVADALQGLVQRQNMVASDPTGA